MIGTPVTEVITEFDIHRYSAAKPYQALDDGRDRIRERWMGQDSLEDLELHGDVPLDGQICVTKGRLDVSDLGASICCS